jgi:hypothetical protein
MKLLSALLAVSLALLPAAAEARLSREERRMSQAVDRDADCSSGWSIRIRGL